MLHRVRRCYSHRTITATITTATTPLSSQPSASGAKPSLTPHHRMTAMKHLHKCFKGVPTCSEQIPATNTPTTIPITPLPPPPTTTTTVVVTCGALKLFVCIGYCTANVPQSDRGSYPASESLQFHRREFCARKSLSCNSIGAILPAKFVGDFIGF